MTNKLKISLLLFLIFNFHNSCKKEEIVIEKKTPTIEWEKILKTSSQIYFNEISYTQDNGISILYYIEENYSLLNVDANGNIIWEKTLEGSPNLVTETNDKGFIINFINSSSSDSINIEFAKLNQNGDFAWRKGLKFGYKDEITDIIQLESSDIILIGNTYSTSSDCDNFTSKILVVRLDMDGNLIWQKSIENSVYNYSKSIVEDNYGNIIITGGTNSSYSKKVIVFKLDTTGELIWETELGDNDINYPKKIICDKNNQGYMLIGDAYKRLYENFFSKNYWLVFFSNDGEIIWEKVIGENNIEEDASVLVQIADGNYIFGGNYIFNCVYNNILYKINTSGQIVWEMELELDFINATHTNGGIILVGINYDEPMNLKLWVSKLVDL